MVTTTMPFAASLLASTPAGAEHEAAAVNPHERRQTAFATARRAFPVAMSVIHA